MKLEQSIWENYKTYRVDRPFIRKKIYGACK